MRSYAELLKALDLGPCSFRVLETEKEDELLHPRKLTWSLKINTFQTSNFGFHITFQGSKSKSLSKRFPNTDSQTDHTPVFNSCLGIRLPRRWEETTRQGIPIKPPVDVPHFSPRPISQFVYSSIVVLDCVKKIHPPKK